MIAIVNISPENSPLYGTDQYELRINNRVLCTFEHEREIGKLSTCLRNAADAFDKQQSQATQKKK